MKPIHIVALLAVLIFVLIVWVVSLEMEKESARQESVMEDFRVEVEENNTRDVVVAIIVEVSKCDPQGFPISLGNVSIRLVALECQRGAG